MRHPARLVLSLALSLPLINVISAHATPSPDHDQFRVAVYIPVAVVQKMQDPAYLEKSWNDLTSQIKIDKVYIETYRSGIIAEDANLEQIKTFFTSHNIQTAGGIAYVGRGDTAGSDTPDEGGGQFVSMCYTDPKQRDLVKHIAELTARHFDEIMLDDFFFANTKYDSDIAAKDNQTWDAFRLKLMDGVSRDLVLGPASAVNPKVKIIIKFPNWYEHFQANGYDLDKQSKMFDGIYTGTETRDPENNDQHLQQYESYEIVRYFDNIAPGRNGGGWVDTYDNRYIDRYAEQLWDTMLAKAPQMMLFQYSDMLRPAAMGTRQAWAGLPTTFTAAGMEKWHADTGSASPITYATAAGYALSQVNAVLGKLGRPVGVASYKPYQSAGEDFLQNYLGMIGIPIDLRPEFPADAHTILLTEQAAFDPDLINKIRAHLEQGGNVVITTGLLTKLQDKGLKQIADIHTTGNVLRINQYWGAFGAGSGADLGKTSEILVPEIAFLTNDAWPVVRGTANGRGAPLLLMDRYSKGILYVLTVPENANDLYALPQPVLTAIRRYILFGFPFSIDAPSKVSLFAYDNNSFVVESFLDAPTEIGITTSDRVPHLRNLSNGEIVDPNVVETREPRHLPHSEFRISLQPHSFLAFTAK
ncbi:MAG TPA: hypothetical protein VGI45_08975 [Terracidiphilus sp.]|jgi:hypothetical protein